LPRKTVAERALINQITAGVKDPAVLSKLVGQLTAIKNRAEAKRRAAAGKPALGRPKKTRDEHPDYSPAALAWFANEFPIHGCRPHTAAVLRNWVLLRLAQCVVARYLNPKWDWDAGAVELLSADYSNTTFADIAPQLPESFDLMWLVHTHDEEIAEPYTDQKYVRWNERQRVARLGLTDEVAEEIFNKFRA
jgi:hypothetical protein